MLSLLFLIRQLHFVHCRFNEIPNLSCHHVSILDPDVDVDATLVKADASFDQILLPLPAPPLVEPLACLTPGVSGCAVCLEDLTSRSRCPLVLLSGLEGLGFGCVCCCWFVLKPSWRHWSCSITSGDFSRAWGKKQGILYHFEHSTCFLFWQGRR